MKTYTREEAEKYVRSCGENDGPDGDAEELRALFVAIYEREPDADDTDLWSLICAGIDE